MKVEANGLTTLNKRWEGSLLLFVLWFVGNVILPVLPVFLVWGVRSLSSNPPKLRDVARDGVLLFYVFALAAILLMDSAKFLLIREPDQTAAYAVAAIAIALPILFVSAGGYLVMALAHAGAKDLEGDKFDLNRLSTLSVWSAIVSAPLCAIFRCVSGIF